MVDVLNTAEIKNCVLMGLHGYVGYMPDPRTAQEVGVLIRFNARKRATKAVTTRWPAGGEKFAARTKTRRHARSLTERN